MKPLRKFEEFVKEGIIIKRTADINRAKSLVEEVNKRKKFLSELREKIGLSDKNANYFIENAYDILIELIRAKLILDGFKSSGVSAHEAEVSYLRNLDFIESNIRFMNELRYFRNGIKYYGKSFDKETALKVLDFLDKTYPLLKKKIDIKE